MALTTVTGIIHLETKSTCRLKTFTFSFPKC